MTEPAAAPLDGNDARRPSLVPEPSKPDVLVRLVQWHTRFFEPVTLEAKDRAALRNDIADGMDAISGLRESDQRRLGMIRNTEGERDAALARATELEKAIHALIGTAVIVQSSNTRDFMFGLQDAINAACVTVGDTDRVSFENGHLRIVRGAALPAPQTVEGAGG